MFLSERLDQLKLSGIGVLVFVHHHVTIPGAAGLESRGVLGKQPEREQY